MIKNPHSGAAADIMRVRLDAANDTFQEIERAGQAYARTTCVPANPREPALAVLVDHIIACGNERPIGFWIAAIHECVELDNDRDLDWIDKNNDD